MTDSNDRAAVTRRVGVTFAAIFPDGPQRKTLHIRSFRVHRDEDPAPPAHYICGSTVT
jgi:hypothetical protein